MPLVGERDDWEQRVILHAGDKHLEIVPTEGVVVIQGIDENGDPMYWDAANNLFVSTYTENPTQIDGVVSRLPFTPWVSLAGRTLFFMGWINGHKSTLHSTSQNYFEAGAGGGGGGQGGFNLDFG